MTNPDVHDVPAQEISPLSTWEMFKADVESLVENEPGTFGVLAIDIDGLKEINDVYGHHEGDVFLDNAEEVLTRLFRTDPSREPSREKTDVIAKGEAIRKTGDEYWVLLRDVHDDDTVAAIKIRAQDLLDDHGIHASVGGMHHEPGETAHALLGAADALMYIDKLRRVPEHSPEDESEIRDIEARLKRLNIPARDLPKHLAAIAFRNQP